MRVIKDIKSQIRLLFRKDKKPYLQLKKITGFIPNNLIIYQTAMRHKSLANNGGSHINNERLEFLGDAVLGCVVADMLYKRYPNKQEGFLTTLRSKLVRRDMLNKLAEKTGLEAFINYSGKKTSAHNSYMNGNAFEAFIGAIYLDQGYRRAEWFINNRMYKPFVDIEKVAKTEENWKSKIIEWCQKYQLDIHFETVSETLMHDNTTTRFTSRVCIEGVFCGAGDGYSKKESHQEAAKLAYNKIRRDKNLNNELIAKKNIRETMKDS